MLYQEITFSAFCDAFRDCGRGESFSYAGKRALFDWLEEYAEDSGQDVELDIVALDCEFAEYADESEVVEEYDLPDMQAVEDVTLVIPVHPHGYIVQAF